MKKIKLSLVVLTALSVSTSAFAADSGFFASISAGQSELESGIGSTTDFSVDEEDTSFSFNVGYKFSKYIAAEIGYRDLGEASITANNNISVSAYGYDIDIDAGSNVAVESDGFTIGIIGILPINDKFDIYAKFGAMEYDVKATATGSGTIDGDAFAGSSSASDDESDNYYGFGAQYNFDENMGLGLQWTEFEVFDTDVNVIEANLVYSF